MRVFLTFHDAEAVKKKVTTQVRGKSKQKTRVYTE
jgi:hypothetical protein